MRNADIILRRVAEAFAAGNPESLPPGPSPATGTGSAVIRGQANVTTGGQTVTGLNFISGSDTHPGGYYCTWNVSTYKTSLAGAVNRIDIVVGWGNGPNCSRDTPGLCPYHMQVTNYY
jgi:hypothetical protein